MKKLFLLFICIILVLSFSGCGSSDTESTVTGNLPSNLLGSDTGKTETEKSDKTTSKTESKKEDKTDKNNQSKVTSSKDKNTESKKDKTVTLKATLPVVRYSPTGNKKMFSDIINLKNGGFAVIGRSETEEKNIPIIRIYDDKCNLVKEHKIDLPWGFRGLVECSGGGFLALTEDMPYIVKIDKDFKVEWTKAYQDAAYNASGYDIAEISPDCFAVLHIGFNEDNGDMEHIISFFDSEGNLIEKQSFIVVESFDIAGNIVADGKGGVYLFTYCNQSTTDKYGLIKKDYKGKDETDAAIIHFNAERKVDWSKIISTKGRDWIEEATIDQDGNLYIALGTDCKEKDKLWDMMYVHESIGNRRMLVKLDKKGNVVYKVPLTSDAMAIDHTHGILLNNGKVNVVGTAYYFDDYNSKYPCKKIGKEDKDDRLFVAYNLSIDDKNGKELHRDMFRNSVENEPRGAVVLKNGTVVIAGSVSAMYNYFDLTFYDEYDKLGALFIYEN